MTENIPGIYAQNYRAAQYDGKVAEKRRREALIALQEAQRSGDHRAIILRLYEYTEAVYAGIKALGAIHEAFSIGVRSRCFTDAAREAAWPAAPAPAVVKVCAKCGEVKTLNKRGQMICRPCSRAIAAHGCARAAAAKIARRDTIPAPNPIPEPVPEVVPAPVKVTTPRKKHGLDVVANGQKGPPAMEVFDAVCETHGLGASVPRMSPNAGRLKAGESLYPAKRVAAL